MLVCKDGTTAATSVGLIAAPLATAGHLLASAPALAALGPIARPPGGPERSGEFLAVLAGGLAGGGVAVLAIAVVLLLLRRAWEPIGTDIALGGITATSAIGGQFMTALGSQAPPLTTTTTLLVTALGLVIGTFIGATRADRSGALAGMPPGNH